MDLLVENWQIIIAICGVISALVVFGGKLADLLLKWSQVLQLGKKKRVQLDTSHNDYEVSESVQHLFKNMYSAESTSTNNGSIKKYFLKKSGENIKYREVLSLWEKDKEFIDFYLSIFKQCGFRSFVWETPPLSTELLDQPFEFVLINNPISKSKPDVHTYKKYFNYGGPNCGIVAFKNLGHDAMLVVPSPADENVNYSGLAEFFAESPIEQQHALWKVLAREVHLMLSDKRVWLSVAGGGISWLHIRIDTRPKYYRYLPYAKQS